MDLRRHRGRPRIRVPLGADPAQGDPPECGIRERGARARVAASRRSLELVAGCAGTEVSATRRLIVNADDFGLSAGVNRGILEAHVAGVVTSASLMVNTPAFAVAAAAARQAPRLSVGLHLNLTVDRKSVV